MQILSFREESPKWLKDTARQELIPTPQPYSVFSSIYKPEPAEGRNEKLSYAHEVTTWNGSGHVPSHTGIQATELLGTKRLLRPCLRDEPSFLYLEGTI